MGWGAHAVKTFWLLEIKNLVDEWAEGRGGDAVKVTHVWQLPQMDKKQSFFQK